MGRKKAGWKKLKPSKNERDIIEAPQPSEGGDKSTQTEERKQKTKRKLRKSGVPQEGGHSQASISEQENMVREGGHSQSSNNINSLRSGGGHSQSSTGKQPHYGHFGRYNEQIDF